MRAWSRMGFLLALGLVAWRVEAAGTPAGTLIENVAEVSFVIDGVPARLPSSVARLQVAELVEVATVAATPTQGVQPGATNRVAAFRVANLGNGPEAVRLELDVAAPGAGFPLQAAAPALYLDADASGTLTAADSPYLPGADLSLPPDGTVLAFAVVAVPADAPDAARGRLLLTARTATGTGTPGTGFPGAGVGGVEAVLGPSGGTSAAATEFLVAGARLALAKSATVVDAEGGTRPEPGARITYQLDLVVEGTGTARGVVLRDPVPPSTTFLPGSLELDGAPLSDAEDADAGALLAAPGRVEIRLGDLPAGATRRARFAVTID